MLEHCSTVNERFITIQHIQDAPDGQVVLVFNKDTNEIYTMKLVDFPFVSPQITKQIRTEVSALTALESDFIIKFYTVAVLSSTASQVIYRMIMEPIDSSLHRLLYREMGPGKRLSLGTVRRILKCILQGIDFCHKNGFVHLDLTPRNIFLIGPENYAKLGGFGHCRESDVVIPVMQCSFGTLQYRAPESFVLHEYVSSATDMWSVGLIFAEMCLGFRLLDGTTEIDINREIIELIGLPSIDQLNSGHGSLIAGFWDAYPWCGTRPFEEKYPELRKLGGPGLDLLRAMLKRNRADRISAEMALENEFIQTGNLG